MTFRPRDEERMKRVQNLLFGHHMDLHVDVRYMHGMLRSNCRRQCIGL